MQTISLYRVTALTLVLLMYSGDNRQKAVHEAVQIAVTYIRGFPQKISNHFTAYSGLQHYHKTVPANDIRAVRIFYDIFRLEGKGAFQCLIQPVDHGESADILQLAILFKAQKRSVP